MTYCVALRLDAGLVLLSDTRTNAGVDNISQYRKMFTFHTPGERSIAMMTSGNLAITQAVISTLEDAITDSTKDAANIMKAPSMYAVAEIVGAQMRNAQNQWGPGLRAANESSIASILVAGQRAGSDPRLYMIYTAGNFIGATDDTPFFQLGEFKYGKPIIDRTITPQSSLEDGLTACLLSMDSTLKSNLSVGMPLDLTIIPSEDFNAMDTRRIEADDAHFHALSESWSSELRAAFVKMREIPKFTN
ncbi:MAG: peptidase [Pseudomonadota bacterium]